MTNLLMNIAPSPAGRALFSVQPAAMPPNQAAGAPLFEDLLQLATVPVPDLVGMPADDVSALAQRKPGHAPGDEDADRRAHDGGDHERITLLPSIAPALQLQPVAPALQLQPVAPALQLQRIAPALQLQPIAPALPWQPAAAVNVDAAVAVVPGAVTEVPAVVPAVPVSIAAAAAAAAAPAPAPAVPSRGPSAPAPAERSAVGVTASRPAFSLPTTAVAASDQPVTASTAMPTAAASSTPRVSAASEIAAGGIERIATQLASQPHPNLIPTSTALNPQPIVTMAAARPNAPAPAPQSLAAALGERLHVQINQRSEHAVIRLDPPAMGSIEIVIRQEAGGLHVQLRASNGEVARQLHSIGDSLRQDLVQRQHGDVSVQVWDGSRDADGRQRHRYAAPWQDDDPGRALHDAGGNTQSAAFALNAE